MPETTENGSADDADRAMYRCPVCTTTTTQSRACPYCNHPDLDRVDTDT